MNMKYTILVTALVVLGVVGSAIAQQPPSVYIDVSEIEGLTPNGHIPQGLANLTIPFRFANVDAARTSISNAFTFKGSGFSPFFAEIEWNPVYPWNWSYAESLKAPAPFFGERHVTYSIPYGKQIIGEAGPDGTGLPADFDDIAFYARLYDVSGVPGGTVTIDTAAGYPWLWSGAEGNLDWGGPYVFTLADDSEPLVPYTYCWPQPTGFPGLVRTQPDRRRLYFVIRGDDPDGMDLESIRLFDKWGPSEEDILVEGDSVVFSCDVVTFLGIAGLRPVTGDFETRYTLGYDMKTGEHRTLTGKYRLLMYWKAEDGDFDGTADTAASPLSQSSGAEESIPTVGASVLSVAEESELLEPSTYCWPQPIVFPYFRYLPHAERRLHFVVKGENPDDVVIESIRVNEQLRPDAEDVVVEGDSVAFSVDFMQFLGASDLRPVYGDFRVPYTLEYDKTTGQHVTLIGEFRLNMYSDVDEFTVPSTYCWPQPIEWGWMRWEEPSLRRLHFVIEGENPNNIVIESIRVFGKLRPDEEDIIVGEDSVAFSCGLNRFLGVAGFLPIMFDFKKPYTLEYDKKNGQHESLTGEFYLIIYTQAHNGDLNLDGTVDLADIQFMAEYFFKGGPKCEDEARMDVDGNGQVDLQDLRELISNVGM